MNRRNIIALGLLLVCSTAAAVSGAADFTGCGVGIIGGGDRVPAGRINGIPQYGCLSGLPLGEDIDGATWPVDYLDGAEKTCFIPADRNNNMLPWPTLWPPASGQSNGDGSEKYSAKRFMFLSQVLDEANDGTLMPGTLYYDPIRGKWWSASCSKTPRAPTGSTTTPPTSTASPTSTTPPRAVGGGSSGAGKGVRTKVAGFRAATDELFCAELVPELVHLEADESPKPLTLTVTLSSVSSFDLCVWPYDANWKSNAAYASCDGEGGVFPLHNSVREPGADTGGPHKTLALPTGVPAMETYMACVVPAATLDVDAEWVFRMLGEKAEVVGENA